MERSIVPTIIKFRLIVIIILIPFINRNLGAQSVTCNIELYNAFINNRMDKWEQVIGEMNKKYQQDKNIDCLYNLTFAQYGFIVYCIISEQREKGEEFLNYAENNSNRLLRYDSAWAEIYSLKAALYGFKIEFNKLRAIKYGLKSLEYMDRAMALDQNNARVWMEKGNITYYIPDFLGGGLQNAIACHVKSVSLFEKEPELLTYNWLYLLVLTNLGRWYTEAEKYESAGRIYEKILQIEPDYLWVKNELYPDLQDKTSGKNYPY